MKDSESMPIDHREDNCTSTNRSDRERQEDNLIGQLRDIWERDSYREGDWKGLG